ncbi:ferredoxin [Saccharopolyspora rosea]|uniref:Ferredoxin n=1 Tax=Saccharopolyspora rosea TaxID=524884 RepID=A0ABW3FQB3_9PSEU|nr:ferredoxin [Saccharopolyspora rosea]
MRTDERILDAPMQPVRCTGCAALVRVRKSSWEQTSIQWNAEAVAACAQREAAERARGGVHVDSCPTLRTAIATAAERGDLPVLG